MLAKKFALIKHFQGEPKETDFLLLSEELPKIKRNQILVEAEYWSIEPYMKTFASKYHAGITMFGAQVGRILESKSPNFPVGRHILGYFGWRTHTVADPTKVYMEGFPKSYLLDNFKDLPYSLALGVLGMPGNAAYFGFMDVCKPGMGDTIVISGAAGAFGSTVGQIAKIKGCRTIGIAGANFKTHWLKNELNFDAAINYNAAHLDESIRRAAPNGVDCYFDSEGGAVSRAVLNHMNFRGRVVICENCARKQDISKRLYFQAQLPPKELQIHYFTIFSHSHRLMEGINANLKWIREGKLKYRETIIEGFENMPRAFISLFKGENTGKPLVKAVQNS